MLGGSGGVMSTADDMAKWMNFHLYEGQNSSGAQVMQKAHLEEVHAPRFLISSSSTRDTQVPQFPVTNNANVYAHGFKRGFYRGVRIYIYYLT